MELTVWGARGSIPVSGREYVKYGGDTTCLALETGGGDMIIFDAGSGLRALGNEALAEGRTEFHFLLTHAHWDHLLGFPFFKPLYRKNVSIFFHGCTFAQQSIRTILQGTMRAPFFTVDLTEVAASLQFDDECLPEFGVAGLRCFSCPLNHPNQGYGFIVQEVARRMAFFPDNELGHHHRGGKSFDHYRLFLEGVDVLFHDAEFLPSEYTAFAEGWGHSVYPETVRLGAAAKVGRLVLWHLNQDRSDAQADELLRAAREELAAAGAESSCDLAATGMTVSL